MGSTRGEGFASAFGRFQLVDRNPNADIGDENKKDGWDDKHGSTGEMYQVSDVSIRAGELQDGGHITEEMIDDGIAEGQVEYK